MTTQEAQLENISSTLFQARSVARLLEADGENDSKFHISHPDLLGNIGLIGDLLEKAVDDIGSLPDCKE